MPNNNCLDACNTVIELKAQFCSLQKELTEIKTDIKAQDMAIRHNDIIIGEMHSDIKKLLEVKDDLKSHIKEHNDNNKETVKTVKDRSWSVIILMIGNILTILFGVIAYFYKN